MAEIFFPWGDKPCHQICLYYLVDILTPEIPKEGSFIAKERLEGRGFDLEFHWVPFDRLHEIEVYPANAGELLGRLNAGVQHFVYKEDVPDK